MLSYERQCVVCDNPFTALRSHAKTCGMSKCRNRLARMPKRDRMALLYGLKPTDFWRTSPEDWAWILKEYGPSVDFAAIAEDTLCKLFITPEQDALTRSWSNLVVVHNGAPGCGFVNPPFSNIRGGLFRWACKAHDESQLGIIVVMLVPPAMGSKYMQYALAYAHHIRIWPTRRSFIDPNTGELTDGNRGDSCLVIWRPGPPPMGRAVVDYIDLDPLTLRNESPRLLLTGPTGES